MGKDTHKNRRTRKHRRVLTTETLESRVVLAADLAAMAGVDSMVTSGAMDLDSAPAEINQVAGDLNSDGFVNATDIDLLAAAIRVGDNSAHYDVNDSSAVDQSDMDMLIHDILATEYGDANLDRMVSDSDRVIWQTNKFQTNVGWANGNFNGDEYVDVTDFNVWNSNRVNTNRTVVVTGLSSSSPVETFSTELADLEETATELVETSVSNDADLGDSSSSLVVLGDFNNDGLIDAADIDMLSHAIRQSSTDQLFDLNDNGLVEKNDMEMMVHDILNTTYGDANLDGNIDVADLHRVTTNIFSSETGWERGDFNGDSVTDVADFNLWNMHRFAAPPTVTATGTTTSGSDEAGIADEPIAEESNETIDDSTRSSSIRSGDLNDDSVVDAQDIDMLTDAIRKGDTQEKFDINEDSTVDRLDVDVLIHDILETTYGDADLSGFVDTADEGIWTEHRFQSNTGWASADFNGDGFTDVSDFNLLNSHRLAAPTVITTGTDLAVDESEDKKEDSEDSKIELAVDATPTKVEIVAAQYRRLRYA